MQDDIVLNTTIVKILENTLEENGYQVDVVFPKRSSPSVLSESILGAHGCICGPECSDLFWILPYGIRVIECMNETGITGASVRTAGACKVEYWVVLLPRGKPEIIGKLCSDRVLKSLV